jgi:hypothetical protein
MAPNNSFRLSPLVFAALLIGSGCATEVTGGSGGEGGEGASGTTVSTASSTVGSTSQASVSTGMGCAVNCADIEAPACMQGVCNMMTGQCEFEPGEEGAPCEDGLFCTDQDVCMDGECVGGPLPDCGSSADPCLETICDEDEDECSVAPKANGSSCIAEDPCTTNAICQNGQCLGAPKDCSATPVADCEVAVCDPMQAGACVPIIGNVGLPCDDSGDLCMVQKVCDAAGACVGGVPKNCSAFTNGCNNGVCEPATGACFSDPVPPGGTCLEATDTCNIGICDNNGNCNGMPTNDGGACVDGSSCTVNDVCSAGTCAGVPDPNYTIYFSDSFASNNQGWTLGTEWQIGPAQASACTFDPPGDDPASDHTTSADNGIAGVVIGGCYSTAANHAPYCMVSPNINANPVSGSVFLSYYRHLHTDYPSFMSNTVEVSSNGGTTWNTVYAVPSGQVQNDSDWTFASFDITAFKSATLKVRFCHEVTDNIGIYEGGGWNVDDVTIASSACP